MPKARHRRAWVVSIVTINIAHEQRLVTAGRRYDEIAGLDAVNEMVQHCGHVRGLGAVAAGESDRDLLASRMSGVFHEGNREAHDFECIERVGERVSGTRPTNPHAWARSRSRACWFMSIPCAHAHARLHELRGRRGLPSRMPTPSPQGRRRWSAFRSVALATDALRREGRQTALVTPRRSAVAPDAPSGPTTGRRPADTKREPAFIGILNLARVAQAADSIPSDVPGARRLRGTYYAAIYELQNSCSRGAGGGRPPDLSRHAWTWVRGRNIRRFGRESAADRVGSAGAPTTAQIEQDCLPGSA